MVSLYVTIGAFVLAALGEALQARRVRRVCWASRAGSAGASGAREQSGPRAGALSAGPTVSSSMLPGMSRRRRNS